MVFDVSSLGHDLGHEYDVMLLVGMTQRSDMMGQLIAENDTQCSHACLAGQVGIAAAAIDTEYLARDPAAVR